MSWNPDALEQAVDTKMDATQNPPAPVQDPPAADPAPVVVAPVAPVAPVVAAPVADAPVVVTPEVPIPPAAEAASETQPPAEVAASEDLVPFKTAVEKLGGIEELEVVERIASPFLAPELNVEAVVDMLERDRGDVVAQQFAEGMLNIYAASYTALILENPDRIVTDPPYTPEGQQQMAIRNEILAFRDFRASGGSRSTAPPAPPVATSAAPAGAPAPTGVVDPNAYKPINFDDYNLPPELEARIRANDAVAQTAITAATALDDRVKKLEGFQETDTQRRDRETKDAQNKIANERWDGFITTVTGPAERFIEQVKFSTNPDQALAEKENQEFRRQIGVLVATDLRSEREEVIVDPKAGTKMTTAAAWAQSEKLHLKGDILGARRLDAALRIKGQELAKKYADTHQRRMLDSVEADKAVANNNQPDRVQVSGAGSGAAPVLPLQPAKSGPAKSWENIDAQVDAKFAQRQPSAPVG
jgi:hypothetical protein